MPSTAPAPEADPEPAQPTFLAFAGTAKRLDGKPAVNPIQPVPVPLPRPQGLAGLYGSSPPAASGSGPSSKPAADVTTSGKTGTFVSTGNRLMDKLLKEKVGVCMCHLDNIISASVEDQACCFSE